MTEAVVTRRPSLITRIRESVSSPRRALKTALKFGGTGALVVGLEACGPTAPTTTNPTETTHQTPTTVVNNSPMPSETAFQTQLATNTPDATPTATVEATPFTLPSVDSIMNPSPSEIPQAPITTQQMRDAVTRLTSDSNSGLSTNNIRNINTYLQTCIGSANPSTGDRLAACINLVSGLYSTTGRLTNQDARQEAYQAAFDVYWWTIGTNGIGPDAKTEMDTLLQAEN